MGKDGDGAPKDAASVRGEIDSAMIVRRLQDHIAGRINLDGQQVNAALGLLRKTVPDLGSVELTGDPDRPLQIIGEKPMTVEEWTQRYGAPSLTTH